MWRITLVAVVACTEHGETPPGGTPLMPSETEQVAPILCTSGEPGDPTCPVNHISLIVGSDASFTVRPVADGLMFPDLTFTAGQAGLVIINPKVVIGGMAIGPLTVIDLGAAQSETLPSFVVVDAAATDPMSLRFDSINVQR